MPALAGEILTVFMRDDREAIEELVDAAPCVFDAAGDWLQSRSTAALLVVGLVIDHARDLSETVSRSARSGDKNAVDILRELTTTELPSWMKRAFARVIARTDGIAIALGYLAHLAARTLGYDDSGWNPHVAAFAALADVLAERGVTVDDVRGFWMRREQAAHGEPSTRSRVTGRTSTRRSIHMGEGARTIRVEGFPLFWGATNLFGENASVDVVSALWGWLRELLRGRDDGLWSLSYSDARHHVPHVIGQMLSRVPSSEVAVREAYADLEPQRRRALFGYLYEDAHSDVESVLLLRIGLNVAIVLGGRTDTRAVAHELFYWSYDAALRLWLTAVLDSSKAKRDLLLACFATMPHVFGSALKEPLQKTLPAVARDPLLLAAACNSLHCNGVDGAHLSALVAEAGADLPAALRDAHQWALLTGREVDFPEYLTNLANRLDIPLGPGTA
jgi:hypothetical protein